MKNKKAKYFFVTLACAVIFGIGMIAGVWFQERRHVHPAPFFDRQASHGSSAEWEFINPLLECGEMNSVANDKVLELKDRVGNLILVQKQKGNITDATVYFRDLNNGPWFGVNEQEAFAPASLLKVPLMISAFFEAERNPSLLKRMFKYKGGSHNAEYFMPSKELVKGDDYSLPEAVEYMIRYSDNNAYFVLFNALSSTLSYTYEYLSVPKPYQDNYTVSARTYSSFFRILYNSTFLNREYSEQALRILSQTEFDRGLVAGVPKSIKVAHKFGERQGVATGERYLHDCGIIYEENTPYILCVMTKGNDFEQMVDVIADISKTVYGWVGGAIK